MLVRWLVVLAAFAAPVAHAQNAEIRATVTDERGKPVADAVVIAVPADGNLRLPAKPREDIVDQVDKEFMPKVQAVLVGTPVTFPNRDSVRHQVYSFSAAKRFELPLYTGVPQAVVFDKPGVVILGCNIHDWMVGYIYVSESPYFATTDAAGRAVLTDVPPRGYIVRVWHPQLGVAEEVTRKSVDVLRGQHADVAWTVALKPEVRIRRAPVAGQRGGY
ncbi:MAG: methylamine utilization protein [Casimicrobiaceae bacterium]